MKQNRIVLLSVLGALLLFSTALSAQDKQDEIDKWIGFKPIIISGESQYKSVALDADVYKSAQSDLSDLRIVDDHKDFVPFFVKTEYMDKKSEKTLPARRINIFNEFEEDKVKFDSIFDFQITAEDEEFTGTSLRLLINKRGYSNQVEIYGRSEKGDWGLLLKDTIYNLDDLEKNTIKFARGYDYQFYRIKIIDNKDNLNIEKCELISNFAELENKKYLKKEMMQFSVQHKDDITLLRIQNMNNLKLKSIDLGIEGNFDRQFEFLPFYDSDEPVDTRYFWGNGKIYNYSFKGVDLHKTIIPLEDFWTEKEFYIKIINNDNKPLKVTGIEAEYFIDYLVFEKTESETYTLYFGNDDASSALYDIEKFKKYIEKETLDLCELGELNTLTVENEATKRKIDLKLILNLFIIIAALVMGLLIVLKLRKK